MIKGKLRISKSNGSYQYFRITESTTNKGIYIPKGELSIAKALAQQDYDLQIAPLLRKLNLTKEKLNCTHQQLDNVYKKMHPARKCLITPIRLPDNEYAEQWQAMPYTGKSFAENTPLLMTAKGERVRSKSEIIIADTLARLGIPYRYEAPVKLEISAQLKTGTTFMDQDDPKTHHRTSGSQVKKATKRLATFYPDFTCLNIRTRKEFIWEHFGMMEDSEYAKNAVEKERIYASAGYVQGVNFIATTETTDMPLNSQYVEMIAEKLLK